MSRQKVHRLLWVIISSIACLSSATLSNDVLAEPSTESATPQPTFQPEAEFNPRLDIENETAEEEDQTGEEEDFADEDTAEAPEEPTPVPPKAFKEFFGFNQQFTEICRELTADGRNQAFYQLVVTHADDYKLTCAACRALLKSFEVPCKPKKMKGSKPKKGETPPPTPTPRARQREPHPELVSAASSLFGELARTSKSVEEITRAIREFDRLMSDQKWSTPSEQEYFAAFVEVIKAPFLTKIRQQEKAEKKEAENHQPVSHEASKKALDDLF